MTNNAPSTFDGRGGVIDTRPCLKKAECTNGEDFFAPIRARNRRQPLRMARLSNAAWHKKTRPLGVLPFFKQALTFRQSLRSELRVLRYRPRKYTAYSLRPLPCLTQFRLANLCLLSIEASYYAGVISRRDCCYSISSAKSPRSSLAWQGESCRVRRLRSQRQEAAPG